MEREKFAVILLPFEREDVEGQRLYPPGRIIGEIHTVTFRPGLPLAFGQEMNNVEYLGEVFNAVPTVPWRGEFAVILLLFVGGDVERYTVLPSFPGAGLVAEEEKTCSRVHRLVLKSVYTWKS